MKNKTIVFTVTRHINHKDEGTVIGVFRTLEGAESYVGKCEGQVAEYSAPPTIITFKAGATFFYDE